MTERPVVRVSVTDVDMRFFSMVRFMVKWAIAAIPAFLILLILGAVFWAVLLGIVQGIGSSLLHKSADVSDAAGSSPPLTAPAPGANSDSKLNAPDAAVAAYFPKIAIRNVKVAKSALDQDGVWGEIKNAGDQSLKEVELTIYCLDANGNPIFEKQIHPVLVSELGFGENNQPLKPGYSRQFGVRLNDAPSEWSKKVNVKVTSLAFQ